MEWLPIETRVTLRTVLIHPYDVLTPGCCCRTSLKRSRIFSLQYQQDQCRSDGHHGEFASLPLLPPQYDDEIVSKQIIKYVATCTGMHLSLPTSHPSIPSIPSQQVQTLQASEFSDWMSSNGYSFSGTEKVQAFNNFVTNMVSG